MALVLTVLSGPREGAVVRASGPERVAVGRADTNDLHVVDATMSRRHAVLVRREDGWWVEDQQSRNGVWLGERRVQRQRLEDGAVLRFGKITEVRVTVEDQTAGAAAVHTEAPSLPPFDPASLLGTSLDGYLVHEALPRCGPGLRLFARDETIARDVALRVFGPDEAGRVGFAEAFEREVETASRLVHPQIVQVLDRGERDGVTFVVEECARGRGLAEILAERRFVRPPDAAKVALHAIGGLIHTIEEGVALPHLSSSDVLVNDAFDARIVRFADPLQPTHRPPAAEAGFVAPEVALGRPVSEEVALVYSIGALLYRMVCGIPPHDGETVVGAAERALRQPPASVRRVTLKVSPALEHVVHDALDPDPQGRLPRLEDFRDALRRAF